MTKIKPHKIIDQCVAAYNQHDLEGFCRPVSDDVVILDMDTNQPIAQGIDAYRKAYQQRFQQNPQLHVKVLQRTVVGNHICDEEMVTGLAGEDVRAMVIYTVDDKDLITKVQIARQFA